MFKSFDTLSKRILSIALAVSMVLASASLFMFSINKANAKEPEKVSQTPTFHDEGYIVANGNVYWFYNSKLYYRPLTNAYHSPNPY